MRGTCNIGLAVVVLWGAGCARREQVSSPAVAAWAHEFPAQQLHSASCAACHPAEATAWRTSHHAAANRPVDPSLDTAAFSGSTAETPGVRYTFEWDATGNPLIRESRGEGSTREHRPVMAIAHEPLRQYLVESEPGRYQVTETAWDPQRAEWFGVFGDEKRTPGEWGHWTGRGMNWNSMCARCHVTAYAKNYDAAGDRYHSRWIEHGISCVQCHGALPGHELPGRTAGAEKPLVADRARMMETCAACHSRAESLTAASAPGDAFDDHYRLQLPVEPGLYHADGQIRDEVFEFGSFRHSKMHTAGVTCMDCHEPHSGGLVLPLENNALCLQCHQTPGKLLAPQIDPIAHSRHAAGSAGNRCVECHMVETTYMQRDPRRDHGFILPDPVLTRELGVPNACSRCHDEQPLEWVEQHFESWYGEKMSASRQRARARVVADAWAGKPDVLQRVLALLETEKVPAWRASFVALADQVAPGDPATIAAARAHRDESDALIRAAAVRALASSPADTATVQAALNDPSRLVRLDAAWAQSATLAPDAPVRRELDAYLEAARDQPAGLLRLAQDVFNRGRPGEAAPLVRRAMEWDPFSAPLAQTLGVMLSAEGKTAEAAQAFERAAALDRDDAAAAFSAALAWSEAGNPSRAESMLGETLRRDPTMARAWYNYGLLQAQSGRRSEAIVALTEAARLAPRDPDAPYALATVFAQLGRIAEARDAARRTLALEPGHGPAAALLRQLETAAPR